MQSAEGVVAQPGEVGRPATGSGLLRVLLGGDSTAAQELLAQLQAAHWQPESRQGGAACEPSDRGGIAYRFFSSARRRLLTARLPAFEHFSAAMLAAASNADLLLLLVDPREDLRRQIAPLLLLAGTAGVGRITLLPTRATSAGPLAALEREFRRLANEQGITVAEVMPLRSGSGEGFAEQDCQALARRLDDIELAEVGPERPLLSVQQRGPQRNECSASLVSGCLQVGMQLRNAANGELVSVQSISSATGVALVQASEGELVRLHLSAPASVAVGDLLAPGDQPLELSDQFEASLIWLHGAPGLVGRRYQVRLAGQWATAALTSIKQQVDPASLALVPGSRSLARDQVAICNLALSRPLAFDTYSRSRALGGFLLLDADNGETLAAGVIRHSLRRAQNVHLQALSIGRAQREALNGHPGKVIWFTGLSGSGKSTIANALEQHLHAEGKRTYVLDGDNVRHGLNKDLGFTEADRVENIRRVAEVARLMMDAGVIVMTAFISPFRREREMARELIGAENFIEVYVSTPLAICEQRDVKGLYRKARSGQLPNMTGIDSPYEPPEQAELEIDASQGSLTLIAERISRHLQIASG